ncbi:MAG: ABC transporter permease [Christensenella hongkongensis]|uniref:ABC transporter permease n=1 Tax=Christensenella hongkongensis TaxID=270498 RepID=UPI002671F16E|nr:ABC transporter permease [Christensenella hongkongensis]MDY3003874.1 ABC transporter permease [Christensenella hongkongensis]
MKKVGSFLSDNVALLGFIAVFIIGCILSSTFYTAENIGNVLRSASIMGIVSIGMTFVILCGSIDLSVSSVFALSGYFFIVLAPVSPVLAILVPIAVGAAVGLLNGLLVTKMSIPAFVGTLASMLFVRGLVLMLTKEVTVKGQNMPEALQFIGRGSLGSGDFLNAISFPLILFIALIILTSWILKKRSLGRAMYIVGGNAEAAKMMGVSVHGTMFAAHTICGLMAGVAGIVFASRVGSATPLAGTGYEMYAIAAVVIGGASLEGGIGKMSGTLFGALIMGSFTNIFSLQKFIDPVWQNAIIGIILLVVVVLQSLAHMRVHKIKTAKADTQKSAS